MSGLLITLLRALRRHCAALLFVPWVLGDGNNCAQDLCVVGCDEYCDLEQAPPTDGPFLPTFVLTFDSLSTKTLPARIEDDGDTKDVLVKDRVGFKPGKGLDPGLAKRLRMKSKRDDGQACVAHEVQMTGPVSAQVVVAVDSTEGLVDGQSLAFLERRPVGAGLPDRVEAVWNAGIDGFTVRARVDGELAGDTLDLPGYREARLFITLLGDGFALQAGGVDPPAQATPGDAPGATLAGGTFAPGEDTAAYALGAEGLGTKASFWFAQFRLEFPYCDTGEVETDVTLKLALALDWVDEAEFWLDAAPTLQTTQAVYNAINAASFLNGDAWELLIAANEADTLLPTTNGPKAEATVKSAQGLLVPASQKLFTLLQAGGTSPLSVKSHVIAARKKLGTALALVNGFKSSSNGKLLSTVEFSVE